MEAILDQNFRLPPKPDFPEMQRASFCNILIDSLTSNQYPLDYLNISHQRLENEKMLIITTALENNTTIKTLILSGNSFSYTRALCDLLSKNQTITALYLENNDFRSHYGVELAQSLKANKTLTTLFIGDNVIGNNGAAAFGECLAVNSNLKTLDLRRNLIRDQGIIELAAGLAKNRGLTKLCLHANFFGEEGARALAECLKENNTLESLDFGYCLTNGSKAVDLILQSLQDKKNRSVLKELKMDKNKLGEQGAIALAKAITNNYGLKCLEMANAYSTEECDMGLIAIFESIAYHPSIAHIDMRYTDISHRMSEVMKMLEKNTRIISFKVREKSNPHTEFPEVFELLNKNKDRLSAAGKWLVDHFSQPMDNQEIDREILKYYQACDHEVLIEHIGKDNYEKAKRNVDRYIATHFLKLTGCTGNGKSTMEQLSPQTHLLIFSYLDLGKCLWLKEIYGNSDTDKVVQINFESNKAVKDIQDVRDKNTNPEETIYNMW